VVRLGIFFALSSTSVGTAALGDASAPKSRPQVIGGHTIGADEFAATGALLRKVTETERAFVCTGTLIAPGWVLTAAHCARAGDGSLVFAFGANPLEPEREVTVSAAFRHPHFTAAADAGTAFHDIALVALEEPVNDVRPELLQAEPPELGAQVDLVGYGSTALPPREERVKNAGRATIDAVLPAEISIGESGSVQNCVGDSGGPAFAVDELGQRRLVSVTSRSAIAAEPCRKGTIHTRVDAHSAFIRDAMSQASDGGASAGCALTPQPTRSTNRAGSTPLALVPFVLWAARKRGRAAV
jgi:secreted trypsin-like serine protease